MNVCFIAKSTNKEAIYLYEEFKKKNFTKVFLVDLAKLNIRISNKSIGIGYSKKFAWDVYIIIARSNDFSFNYLLAEVLQKKATVLPSPKAILNCSDRGLLAKVIFEAKVKQPLSYISLSTEGAKGIATRFKKCALKFANHGGKGVAIVNKSSNASEFVDIFSHLEQPFYIQKYISGDIIKVLVVGDEVIAMKEQPKPGEARSNDGKREHIRLDEKTKAELIGLSTYLGASLFEVDLIEKGSEHFIIDLSLSPSLEMYSEISGRNVGALYADYILQKHS